MSGEKKTMDKQGRKRLTKVLNKYYQSQNAINSLHSCLPDKKMQISGKLLSKFCAFSVVECSFISC